MQHSRFSDERGATRIVRWICQDETFLIDLFGCLLDDDAQWRHLETRRFLYRECTVQIWNSVYFTLKCWNELVDAPPSPPSTHNEQKRRDKLTSMVAWTAWHCQQTNAIAVFMNKRIKRRRRREWNRMMVAQPSPSWEYEVVCYQ